MRDRRTKIIATVGPASWDAKVLGQLIDAGVDVFRLNFSHGDRDRHARTTESIRDAASRAGREVALLGDLPGPKLRIGELRGDVAELETGTHVKLTPRPVEGDEETIPVDWPGVSELHENELVYLADGAIRLRVCEPEDGGVECEVEVGGTLSSHKGMNIPGTTRRLTTDCDLDWVEFAVGQGFDLLAVSFVSSAADLEPAAGKLRALGSDIPLIAKIEKRQAAENAEEIARAATGGIMVARGDLGIELPLAQVPVVQKRLIRTAGRLSQPAITATQMLASMVTEPRPTRAEVTDVANAIYDGSDAVMLSEETAVGRHAVEAVRVMDRIARATQPDLPYGEWLFGRTDQATQDIADSAWWVPGWCFRPVGTHGLLACRPPCDAALLCCWRLGRGASAGGVPPPPAGRPGGLLLFGVTAVLSEQETEVRGLLADCAALASRYGVAASGDLIAITAGLPDQELGTNLFEVHRVP